MGKKTLSIIAAGDLCMWPPLDTLIGTGKEDSVFQQVKPLFNSVDFRLVNLENPLTNIGEPIPKSGPNIRSPEEGISIVTAGRFDCTILANNHIGDYGPKGVIRTLNVLADHKIGYVGAGKNIYEARKPWIREKNGITLAVLATNENEFGTAEEDFPGSNGFNFYRIREDIISACNQADFVLMIMHGGNEYNPVPSPLVVDRYRSFIDAGADAVIGMHPHCVQGCEIYKNHPIIYSTGNFLFCNKSISDAYDRWYYGYLPHIVFGDLYPEMVIHPYRFTPDGRNIILLANEEKSIILRYLERISKVISDRRTLQNHYKGWIALEASKLLYGLYHKPDIQGPLTDLPSLNMRNILTCESHNDLVRNYIKILCDGTLEECEKYIPFVRELQKIY